MVRDSVHNALRIGPDFQYMERKPIEFPSFLFCFLDFIFLFTAHQALSFAAHFYQWI